MSEEEKQMFNKMIYCNLINGEQALKFNRKYEDLQQKVEQLENMRKEAVDYMKENCDIITIDRGWIIRSELTTTGLGKLFKILNKGDSK